MGTLEVFLVALPFEGKTNIPPITYSSLGSVDITDFSESYEVDIGGKGVQIKSLEEHSYEPVNPLVDGTSNIISTHPQLH